MEVSRPARHLLVLAALSLPAAQNAAAAGPILYTRAIGEPYDYVPPDSAVEVPAAAERARQDAIRPGDAPGTAPTDARRPDLPGLGSESAPAEEDGPSWSRILLGVVIVGAMVALASKGSGGGDVNVGAGVDVGGGGGVAPPPAASGGGGTSNPPASGGSAEPAPAGGGPSNESPPSSGGSSGGGSGITIGIGNGNSNGGSNSNGSGDRNDDRDDDREKRKDNGKGKGKKK